MIFIQVNLEPVVQVNDSTRLNASRSYLTPDEAEVTLLEIEPDTGLGFITVPFSDASEALESFYLDWVYETDGEKIISFRVTTDGAPKTVTKTISIVTEENDNLFTTDQDILTKEVDLEKFLRPGRKSFLDYHREARQFIMDELNEQGYTNANGERVTPADLHDKREVRQWSKYLVLHFIFDSIEGDVDDIYATKSTGFMEEAQRRKDRAFLSFDFNQDGEVDTRTDLKTGLLVRR